MSPEKTIEASDRPPLQGVAGGGPARSGEASLEASSLAGIFLYGLTLDDEDPIEGIFRGIRRETALLAALVESRQLGVELDEELAPTLEGLVRRLDVGLELLRRSSAGGLAGELAAQRPRGPEGP
jgi:hypothetical protein